MASPAADIDDIRTLDVAVVAAGEAGAVVQQQLLQRWTLQAVQAAQQAITAAQYITYH